MYQHGGTEGEPDAQMLRRGQRPQRQRHGARRRDARLPRVRLTVRLAAPYTQTNILINILFRNIFASQ